jgi:hypothetical protein
VEVKDTRALGQYLYLNGILVGAANRRPCPDQLLQ